MERSDFHSRQRWRAALVWAVPFGIWLLALPIVPVGLAWSLSDSVRTHRRWTEAIAVSRAEQRSEWAADQEAWQRRDLRNGILVGGLLTVALGLLVAAPFGYRRFVPADWRAGGRGFALALPALAFFVLVGYMLLAVILQGTMSG
jgi:hypothetical protein